MFMLSGLAGLVGAGGATTAAAGTAAAGTAATAATSGFSISSVLQGLATVGGIVATIQGGQAEAAKMEMAAKDAEAEKSFETLQSVDRKRSILAAAADAVGEGDVAYASSGVDLSFGSARQARTDAYRQTDMALETDSGTTGSRIDRLTERASNFRSMAKRMRSSSLFDGLLSGLKGGLSLSQQY